MRWLRITYRREHDAHGAAVFRLPEANWPFWFASSPRFGNDYGVHDPGKVFLRRGLRIALLLPLAFAIVQYGLNMPNGSLYASFAVMGLLGFADFGGPNRDRFVAYVLTACTGVVIIVFASLASYYIVSAVLFAAIVTWALIYAGVLRGYIGAAGMAVILPMAIGLTSTPSVAAIGDRLIGWSIGATFAVAGAMLLWPYHARSLLRTKISTALSAEAAAVRALWPRAGEIHIPGTGHYAVDAVSTAIEDVHTVFDGRFVRPGEATPRDRALVMALDESHRLKSLLKWTVQTDTRTRSNSDAELAQTTADCLDQCAQALESKAEAPMPSAMNAARERHWRLVQESTRAELGRGNVQEVYDAACESFQVRLAALQCQMIASDVRGATSATTDPNAEATFDGVSWRSPDHRVSPWQMLTDQFTLSSPWFRTSLRSGLAVGLGILVVNLLDLQHGFWVVLGTLSALRLDSVATRRTALQAFGGTVAGFVVGLVGLTLFATDTNSAWIALPVCAFLAAYTPGAVSVFVGQAAFTIFIIVLFALYEPSRYSTAEIRLTDVTIGLAISALVSVLMWPRGVVSMVCAKLTTGILAASDYLVAAYDRASFGTVREANVKEVSLKAQAAIVRANETFDLACTQGGRQLSRVDLWTSVANIANQLEYAAQIVTALSRIGLFDRNPRVTDDAMLVSAQRIRARIQAATLDLATLDDRPPGPPGQSPPPDPGPDPGPGTGPDTGIDPGIDIEDGLDVVRERVLECLQDWTTRTDDEVGAQALSLVWSQEWLVHASWLADRLTLTVAPAVGVDALAGKPK